MKYTHYIYVRPYLDASQGISVGIITKLIPDTEVYGIILMDNMHPYKVGRKDWWPVRAAGLTLFTQEEYNEFVHNNIDLFL